MFQGGRITTGWFRPACFTSGLSVDICVLSFSLLCLATKWVAPRVPQVFFVDDSTKWTQLVAVDDLNKAGQEDDAPDDQEL